MKFKGSDIIEWYKWDKNDTWNSEISLGPDLDFFDLHIIVYDHEALGEIGRLLQCFLFFLSRKLNIRWAQQTMWMVWTIWIELHCWMLAHSMERLMISIFIFPFNIKYYYTILPWLLLVNEAFIYVYKPFQGNNLQSNLNWNKYSNLKFRHGHKAQSYEAEAFAMLEAKAEALTFVSSEAEAEALLSKPKLKPCFQSRSLSWSLTFKARGKTNYLTSKLFKYRPIAIPF